MKCRTFQKKLTAFQDRRLPPDQMADMESHIQACEQCRSMAAESEAVWDLLARLPEPDPDPFFYTRLQSKMEVAGNRRSISWIHRALLPAMATAMLVLGVLLGSMTGRMSQEASRSELDLFSELPLEEIDLLTGDIDYFGITDHNGENE